MRRIPHILFLLCALVSCIGGDPDAGRFSPPAIERVEAEAGADYSEVVIRCRISAAEGVKEYGIFFGSDQLEKIPASNLQDNAFTVTVGGLEYSSEYRYKAYVDGGRGHGHVESEVGVWRTEDEIPPVAEILKIETGLGADAGKVTLSCFIRNLSATVGKDALSCGICYAPSGEDLTLDGSFAEAEFSPEGNFTVALEGLVSGITYGFRPFTRIGAQTTYGETLTRKIPAKEDVVTTVGFSALTHHSVTLEGALGNEEWTGTASYGFEWNGKTALADRLDETRHFMLTLQDLSPDTEYSFKAIAVVDGTRYYGESLSLRTLPLPGSDADYVDLGLSVLWATCDLGATSPTELGDRYAWGETGLKDSYSWNNYKWCLGSPESIFKYTLAKDSPQPDGKTVLDPEDDAAHILLGGKWRMPTAAECRELLNNCTAVQPIANGGFILTSKVSGYTDQSIFLQNYEYWTSTLGPGETRGAIALAANWGGILPLLLYSSVPGFHPQYEYLPFDSLTHRYSPHLIRPVRTRDEQ